MVYSDRLFLFLGNVSVVTIEIDRIPDSFRDQDAIESICEPVKNAVADMIKSETEKRSTLQSAPLSPTTEGEESEPPLDDSSAKTSTQPPNDGEITDVELWTGKRSKVRREIDLAASTALLELVKENWSAINDRKTSKRTVFAKIALSLRERGVKVTRDPSKAWVKVYTKWRNIKDTYMTFIASSRQTGKGAEKLPILYDELHELLGKKLFFCFKL